MKDSTMEFHFFTVCQWKEEQAFLRRKHREGWRFTGVSFPGFYRFQRCDPEDVIYQLDYNPAAKKDRTAYLQLFQDCGWEYIQDFVGYSYFRKPAAEAGENEEIFCDDNSRLEMMKRVFQGKMIPLLVIFFLILIPNLTMLLATPTPSRWVLLTLYILLVSLYLVLFIHFSYQYWKYWNNR